MRNKRGKNTLRFGFGSPYLKPIKSMMVMQKFPDGSVYQVMPPTSVQDEILKGTNNGGISSAFPNKDTLPPNITQEGHGESDHFEVNHYDFSIEDGEPGSNDVQEHFTNDSSEEPVSTQENELSNAADARENSYDILESPSNQNDNGESQNSSNEAEQSQSISNDFENLLEVSENPMGEINERKEIESWFKII